MDQKISSKSQTKPFSLSLFYMLALFILICIALHQTWQNRRYMENARQQFHSSANLLAENVYHSIYVVTSESKSGGRFVDSFLDTLNSHVGVNVRIVHSESITSEYGFEEEKEPGDDREKKSLKDGLRREWEESGSLFIALPMKAEENCVGCHHIPTGFATVPVGYVLSVVVVKVPLAGLERSGALIAADTRTTVLLTALITILVGFALYRLLASLKRSHDSLEKSNEALNERYNEIKKGRDTLDAITRSAGEAIIMLDHKSCVTFWNPAAERIFGFLKSEIVGKNLSDFCIPEEYKEAHKKKYVLFQETGIGAVVETTTTIEGLHKDGHRIPVELSITSFRENDHWNAVGIVRDITERYKWENSLRDKNLKLEEAHKELERAQDQLVRTKNLAILGNIASGLSHEIKNPLNIISSTTQLLMMDEKLSGSVREACGNIVKMVDRASNVIDELHNLYRDQSLEKIDIDIHPFLERVLSDFEADLKIDRFRIERSFGSGPIIVSGDQDQLGKAFTCILTNAWESVLRKRAMAPETADPLETDTLTVNTQRDNDIVLIRFHDTGIGIPEDCREKIFHPFYSAKESEVVDTGQGLAIANSILEGHGGSIEAQSEEGEGATIIVSLRIAEKDVEVDDLV